MKKHLIIIIALLGICLCLSGCSPAPTLSGIDNTIEIDCGTTFNLKDYLNENLKIVTESENGTSEYKLSDVELIVKCDDNIYNSETGDIDTWKSGEYDVKVSIKIPKHSKGSLDFTLKINPLKVSSSVENTEVIDCGTDLNLKEFFAEKVKITNQSGDTVYPLMDLKYEISCDESIYNAETGKVDTGKYGDFKVVLALNPEGFDTEKVAFTLTLNPLIIDKGFYVYEKEFSEGEYNFLGFCEYKNGSDSDLKITSIEFQFFDNDDVMLGSTDSPSYTLDYLASGKSGYALDTLTGFDSSILKNADDLARVEVLIDYAKPLEKDSTSLEVGDLEIINNYDYNVSGFAVNTVITNPYDKKVDYFCFCVGLYDENGKLIGVMDNMASDGINANSKVRDTASWLPDSRYIPDQVATVRGSARVTSFAD